jgi:hypothetical protein
MPITSRLLLEALMIEVTRAELREVYADAEVIVRTMPGAELTFCCYIDMHVGEQRKMNTWLFDLAREHYEQPRQLLFVLRQRAKECVAALMSHV